MRGNSRSSINELINNPLKLRNSYLMCGVEFNLTVVGHPDFVYDAQLSVHHQRSETSRNQRFRDQNSDRLTFFLCVKTLTCAKLL